MALSERPEFSDIEKVADSFFDSDEKLARQIKLKDPDLCGSGTAPDRNLRGGSGGRDN
jgi:hypothetical protein